MGLPVNRDGHQVYWEADKEEGEGKIPVLVLHGGWGPLGHDGRFLDRSRFRRVYMHQMGWGKSTPQGSLVGNNVVSILGDMEALRMQLGIERWVVAGGSTGAMLALAYAADHPERCRGVLLRGLWCLGREELDYDYEDPRGKATFFPEEWKALLHHRSDPESSVVSTYHSLVTNTSIPWEKRVATARSWLTWDCLGSSLSSPGGTLDMTDDAAVATASIGLQLYVEVPKDPRYKSEVLVQRGADSLAREMVPVRLVAGRQDMLCPPAWAAKLKDRVEEAGGESAIEIVEGGSLRIGPGND